LKISVIGAGYVGLVTAGCLAEIGHHVVCTDNDTTKISFLGSGRLSIYEPGLDTVIGKARKENRLHFSPNPADAVSYGDAVFICVGTPPLPNGDADLGAIDHVARLIAAEARSPKLVVEKSTAPPRTGQELKRALSVYGRKGGVTFRVASNPEFLREGTAVEDFLHPDRIVVGVDDELAERQLHEIYQPVLERKFNCSIHNPGQCPGGPPPAWLVTSISSAELIKHASNSFLALKISYANMVADLAERLGADIEEVTNAVGMDSRIGRGFLNAGLGFGGFLLPKLQAFAHLGERTGLDFSLLMEAEKINRKRIRHVVEKIRRALWVIKGKKLTVLGLAFKANTDDIRFAPAIDLINQLLAEGARISAYDPEAMEKARPLMPHVEMPESAYAAAKGSEALVIATEWKQFRELDWSRIRDTMTRPLIVDARNLLSGPEMKALGFEYYSVGRPG
jgi:UDPglucose 6-dehydrogenase